MLPVALSLTSTSLFPYSTLFRSAVRWCSRVVEIRRAGVVVRRDPDGPRETIPADFVLALTGYTADLSLLRSVGVVVDETSGIPRHVAETMETNVPGVYIAGVLEIGRAHV